MHLVEFANPGRFGFSVTVELSNAATPSCDVGLALAPLFVTELEGKLFFLLSVLVEFRLDALALSLKRFAKLACFGIAALAEPFRRGPRHQLGSILELGQQIPDVVGGRCAQAVVNRAARSAGIVQCRLKPFEGARFGLVAVGPERTRAA